MDASKSTNIQLFWPIGMVSLAALSLGYDEGFMSGAVKPIAEYYHLGSWEVGIMMGILNVMAAPGALLGSWVADVWGRVRSIAITSVILIVGPLLVTVSNDFTLLMVGRVLSGIGVGFAFVIPPLYAAELAPPKVRGRLVTITEIMINLGIVLGYASAFIFGIPGLSPEAGWRLVYGLAMVSPLIVFCFTPFLPESPRWLAKQGRWEEAETSLQRVCSDAEETSAAKELLQQSLIDDSKEQGWSEILCPTPRVRRMLFAGLGVAFFQQACGSESMVYYSPLILDDFGVTKETHQTFDTFLVGLTKLAGAILGGPFLDFVGRRPGVITSSAGCGIALALMVCFDGVNAPHIGVFLVCAFMIVFELGLAPGAFVVGTESYPVGIRAKSLSLGMFMTRLMAGLVSMLFPKMVQAFSMRGTLGTYALFSFIGVAWLMMFVPETKGLPLEEVQKLYDDDEKHLLSDGADSPDYKTL